MFKKFGNGIVSTIKGLLFVLFINFNKASDFGVYSGIFPKSVRDKIENELSVKFLIYGVTKKSLLKS